MAVQRGVYRFVQVLLDHGADPDVTGNKLTPLTLNWYFILIFSIGT